MDKSYSARRMQPTPFTVSVPEDVLKDLRARLGRARLPADFANEDWSYGTNTAYLHELLEYWRESFDWRKQEEMINALPNFRVVIEGIPIHFVYQQGKGPSPLPLICTHGWPWTFLDWRKLIGPLSDPAAHGGDPADAFDVIVPSLPGFGFSTPLTVPGVSWIRTADLWVQLMRDQLGYNRFVASGGDWGTNITAQLGHKYPEHVIGIHTINVANLETWNVERPWYLFAPPPAHLTGAERERALERQRRYASHVAAQVLGPQTLAHAMHDSPAGLCSYLLERRRLWSDCGGDVERCFTKDELLTDFTIYWATESFSTSVRYYKEAILHPWQPSHAGVSATPTAVTLFREDASVIPDEATLSRKLNLLQLRIHDRGGHFAPAEQPETVLADIRDAFRPLRERLSP